MTRLSVRFGVGALAGVTALAAGPQSRAGTCDAVASTAWRSSIDFPSDLFRNNPPAAGEPGWVKFTILTCDPSVVYFQDSNLYPFHHEFCTQFLNPLLGMTVEEFGEATLFEDGRLAVLGAVVVPPLQFGAPQIQEYGIQLIGEDPFDPQDVVDHFNTVRAAVNADPAVQAFYVPTFEQLAAAEQHADFLAANGVIVSSPTRWATGNGCYSKGWALGRLKSFPADEVGAAFLSGLLRPDDILVTDGVPASLPLVAGIISLAPATPNSHVAILANTFQVPFVFLAIDGDVDRADALVGRRIVLRAFDPFPGFDSGDDCEVRLIDVENELTAGQIDEILALRTPPPLDIQVVTPLGQPAGSTDGLTPADVRHFGGKAANFGFLRRSIPDRSPVALGLSFDLWTAFLDQQLSAGQTLRAHIDSVLGGYAYPPADMQALSGDLEAIRDLIEDVDRTSFTPAQQSALLAVLQDPQWGFDPFKKLRFRSSTNVEDTEQFTGAGLYDSKSGCLMDELDGDDDGPGRCDPTENNEKGVFRAIRKVFASFYYDNAVLERLRHGVDESQVGMALLVHHSFPDQIELANGVATLERGTTTHDEIRLVSQLGAESVTNPEPGWIPEVVDVTEWSPGMLVPDLVSSSNLVVLGETVMDWPTDYTGLATLLLAAADRYQDETGKPVFVLDFEYKKVEPGGGALPAGGLVVKQIREIPQPDTTPSITPFLVNEPLDLVPWGSPPGRSKLLWNLSTRNMWLEPAALAAQSIYRDVAMDFTDGCRQRHLEGPVSSLPGAGHGYDAVAERSDDVWSLDALPNPRTYTLQTFGVGAPVSAAESPIVTLHDLARAGLTLIVEHQDPVPLFPGSQNPITIEGLTLYEALDPALEVPVCRTLDGGGGVTAETCYFIHPPPLICGGCAPTLSRFGTTVIEGVTSQPIVLDDYFSQSYSAGNHAFFEAFAFEPQLETGVTLQNLQELEALDIRLIRFDIVNVGEPSTTAVFLNGAEVGAVCDSPAAAGALASVSSELLIGREPDGSLSLSWGPSCMGGDDDFEVYEGVLGDWASSAPRLCSTDGVAAADLAPPDGDAYYLAVPRNANFEGSYGRTGAGAERAPSASACTGQAIATCPGGG